MIKNYFVTALRNLTKNKFFSVINILGLSIGIAACLLISLYVNYELSYDTHTEDINQIYRVVYSRETEGGEKVEFASASPNAGPAIKQNFPEILKYGRAYKVEGIISLDDISFKEENML
ncbi:MAG TPA: ABC transporter permease, partial [Bacteroidales bacterium]|nr:ABC transporter permease [Bacteroidales bacterium]